MFNQYIDFDVKNIGSSFATNPNYKERLNGFDVMIMSDLEYADFLIVKAKEMINNNKDVEDINNFINNNINNLNLESEQDRVIREITKYYNCYN